MTGQPPREALVVVSDTRGRRKYRVNRAVTVGTDCHMIRVDDPDWTGTLHLEPVSDGLLVRPDATAALLVNGDESAGIVVLTTDSSLQVAGTRFKIRPRPHAVRPASRSDTLFEIDGMPAQLHDRQHTTWMHAPSSVSAHPLDHIGQVIGGYEIRFLLGTGGMGAVYMGESPQGEQVAVKVLAPHLSASGSIRQRFLREAHAQRMLDHPAIIPLLAAAEETDDPPWLVMPLMGGGSLDEVLQEKQKLDEEAAVGVWKPLLRGLHHAHSRGFVHRDIKPANVILDSSAHPHLCDFGLVASLGKFDSIYDAGYPDFDGTMSGPITATGTVLGTPAFMSPEQCRGEYIDQRSDLYSFGCLMFHCVCGRPVFLARTAAEFAQRHVSAPPPSPRDFAPDLSVDVAAVILRLLEKKPSDRFATADEVLRVLESGYLSDHNLSERQRKRALETVGAPPASSAPVPTLALPRDPEAGVSVHGGLGWLALLAIGMLVLTIAMLLVLLASR